MKLSFVILAQIFLDSINDLKILSTRNLAYFPIIIRLSLYMIRYLNFYR